MLVGTTTGTNAIALPSDYSKLAVCVVARGRMVTAEVLSDMLDATTRHLCIGGYLTPQAWTGAWLSVSASSIALENFYVESAQGWTSDAVVKVWAWR